MVKLKKFFAIGATMLLGITTLTACNKELKEAQENIDSSTINALNQSKVVRQITDAEFNEFSFLGADFQRDESNVLSVEVSGLAKYNDSQKAFVNFSYNNVNEEFVEVDKDDQAAIINALCAVIQNKELSDFEITPVSSAAVINNTLEDIAESPLDSFNYSKGMAFSVGNVNFNKEEGYVSFEVKSNINYSHTYTQVTYGVTRYVDGKPQYGLVTRTKTDYEDFLHTHRVYVRASEKEMQAMEKDQSLIFDKFYTSVKEKEKDSYVVESLEVESTQEYNTKMMDNIDLKDL